MAVKTLRVVLYGHANCCLCHEAEELLRALQIEYSMSIEKVDVLADEQWSALRECIPVVTVDGRHRVALRIDERRLRRALKRARSAT